MRSGGRVVEGARLESEYTPKAYRGFESLPLRHFFPSRGSNPRGGALALAASPSRKAPAARRVERANEFPSNIARDGHPCRSGRFPGPAEPVRRPCQAAAAQAGGVHRAPSERQSVRVQRRAAQGGLISLSLRIEFGSGS